MVKTFIVQTDKDTFFEINVNEDLYDKYKDMAAEAMAQAFEKFFKGEHPHDSAGLSFIVMAWEQGSDGDPNKQIVASSPQVLRNIGYHELADECQEQIKKLTKK